MFIIASTMHKVFNKIYLQPEIEKTYPHIIIHIQYLLSS